MITESGLFELLADMPKQPGVCELEPSLDFSDFYSSVQPDEDEPVAQATPTFPLWQLTQQDLPEEVPSEPTQAGAIITESEPRPSGSGAVWQIEKPLLPDGRGSDSFPENEALALQMQIATSLKPEPVTSPVEVADLPDTKPQAIFPDISPDIIQERPDNDRSLQTPNNVMQQVTDFLNSTFAEAKTIVFNPPVKPESLPTSLYHPEDSKAAELSFQYKPESLAHSLKIEGYTAKIKVHPADLGQISASIVIKKGMAELVLGTENHQIKHLIEAHLPELRHSFTGSNLQLGEVSVHADSSADKQPSFQQQENRQAWPEEFLQAEEKPVLTRSESLIDTWA